MTRAQEHPQPSWSLSTDPPWRAPGVLRLEFPLRRHWGGIVLLAVMFAIFFAVLVDAFGELRMARADLFSLVSSAFMAAWILGWSIGVACLGIALLGSLIGREVVLVRDGAVLRRFEVFGLGGGVEYDAREMGALRFVTPERRSPSAWRGPHLAFDYRGQHTAIGCALDTARAEALARRIQEVLGATGDGATGSEAPAPRAAAPEPEAPSPPAGTPAIGYGSPSARALIAANLVPVLGVLFLGWRLGDVMVLFWAESAIIGLFTLVKIVLVARWGALFLAPFFAAHFGAFMAVHFLFVYMLFVRGGAGGGESLGEVVSLFAELWIGLLALFASHAYSYLVNFAGRGERDWHTAGDIMIVPYKRIAIMHVAILIGGMIAIALDSPLPALLLLVALKVVADLRAHVREHAPPLN